MRGDGDEKRKNEQLKRIDEGRRREKKGGLLDLGFIAHEII
jgi:hypothetical protein